MAKFKFKFTNPVLTKFFSTSPQAVALDTEARSLAAYATKAGAIKSLRSPPRRFYPTQAHHRTSRRA